MMVVDGKTISGEIGKEIRSFLKEKDLVPLLSVISVAQDQVGESFINTKKRFGERSGIKVQVHYFKPDTDPEVLRLSILSIVDSSDGVVVQLPLPEMVEERKVLNLVPPDKDPDVLNSFSRDAFEKCRGVVMPPVAAAVAEIFERSNISPRGKRVVVVGKGRLVGTPVAAWFRCQGVLPKTLDKNDPPEHISDSLSKADIVVSGIGVPGFITPDKIKKGTVLIDAGTSGRSGQVLGDIDPACVEKSSLFTPVPGGVGPIAVACLFKNLLALRYRNQSIDAAAF